MQLFQTSNLALLRQSYASRQGDFSGLLRLTTKGKGVDKKVTFEYLSLQILTHLLLHYHYRVLAIYKQPELILVLMLPLDGDEVKRLLGSQSSGHSSYLIA